MADLDLSYTPAHELAARIRDVCLRAIAADGVVAEREMGLFDLLDELLPHTPS